MIKYALSLSIAITLPLSAEIKTPLPAHENHTPSLAMDKDLSTYFWSNRGPKKDETFTVTFKKPVRGLNLSVLTGKPDGKDKLQQGVLEISPDGKHWNKVASFLGGKAETALKQNTRAIRLRSTKDQGDWLAIREIKLGNQPLTMFSISKAIQVHGKKVNLTFSIDLVESTDLKSKVKELSDLYFSSWQKIAETLNAPINRTPTHLFLSFRENMTFPAYVSGTNMVIHADHIRKNPEDTIGVFIHELTHFVQNYPQASGIPVWFTEGTADYIRYKTYPNSKWAKVSKAHTNKSKPLGAYWSSTAFLLWVEKEHKAGAVAIISRACKEGAYTNEIWKKLTGKTLKELTEAYKKS